MFADSLLKASFIEKFRRFLFGDDIFVSYSRADSTYALALANELTKRKLSCFLDQWGTPPGKELPKELINTIKRCSTLVLVGTKNAAISENVGKEVKEFLETKRPIIPITFIDKKLLDDSSETFNSQDLIGSLESANWYPLIGGIAKTTDTVDALRDRTPSENVFLRIVNAVQFRSRSKRLRKTFLVTFGAIVGLILLAIFVVNAANSKSKQAEMNTNTAVQKQQVAEDQLSNATQLLSSKTQDLAETNSKLENANTDLKNAEAKISTAESQLTNSKHDLATAQTETEKAQNEADQQTEIAKERRKEAEKQKAIADVRRLSNESSFALSQNNPGLLEQSLIKAVEANRIAEKNRINLLEPISTLRRVLAVTPEKSDRPSLDFPKPLADCEKFAISTNYKSLACLSFGIVEIYEIYRPTESPRKIDFNGDLQGEDISYEPVNLSVSDDGNRVALAMKKIKVDAEDDVKKNCQGDNRCQMVVRDVNRDACDGGPCVKPVYDVEALYLSPDGDLVVFSGISHGNDIDNDDETLLTFWSIKSGSEPINVPVASSDLKGNFSPSGGRFVTAGKDGLDTLVRIYLVGINEGRYPSTERIISVNHDEVKGIAIDDFGDYIAVQANGISVWQSDNGRLKALIPIVRDGVVSFLFKNMEAKNEIVIFNYPLSGNDKKGMNVSRQTSSIVGYEGSEVCTQECDRILYPFTPDDKILLKHENQRLIVKAEGTSLIIRNKSNDTEIDRIDVGEKIEEFGFLESENEIVTVSYVDTGELSKSLGHRYPRNIRKWKIGIQNLQIIAGKKLALFQHVK